MLTTKFEIDRKISNYWRCDEMMQTLIEDPSCSGGLCCFDIMPAIHNEGYDVNHHASES